MYRGFDSHDEGKASGDRWQASGEVSDGSGEPGSSRHWTPSGNPAYQGHAEASRAVWPHGAISGQSHYDDQRPCAESQSHRRDHHAWLVAHSGTTTMKHPSHRHATPDTSATATHPLWGNGHGLDGNRVNAMEEPRQATWTALDGVREPWATIQTGSSVFEAQDGAWSTSSRSSQPAEHGTFDFLASQRGEQSAMGSSRAYSWSSLASQQLADGHAFAASELSCVAQTGGDSDKDDEEDGDDEAGEAAAEAESPVPKLSRYLREMDRRVILDRLAHGEKQVTLAKEFNVSRAAICNLFKHRHEVLARSGENPLAKHPKKKKNNQAKAGPAAKRPKRAQSESDVAAQSSRSPGIGVSESNVTTQSSRSSSDRGGRTSSRSPTGTLNVMATAALQILLSALSDRTRSLQDFKRNSDRVLWLILEEALAHVPVKEVYRESDEAKPASPRYEAESPACAISMEPRTINATPMLDIFQLIEPNQPSGIATVSTAPTERSSLTVEIADTDLPKSLRGYNVFLLNVVAASGEAVCATIERLLSQFDVAEGCVTVVALFSSSEVVAMVQCKYPLAKIVTARIDSTITRRRVASTPVDLILHRVRQAYSAETTS